MYNSSAPGHSNRTGTRGGPIAHCSGNKICQNSSCSAQFIRSYKAATKPHRVGLPDDVCPHCRADAEIVGLALANRLTAREEHFTLPLSDAKTFVCPVLQVITQSWCRTRGTRDDGFKQGNQKVVHLDTRIGIVSSVGEARINTRQAGDDLSWWSLLNFERKGLLHQLTRHKYFIHKRTHSLVLWTLLIGRSRGFNSAVRILTGPPESFPSPPKTAQKRR